MGYTHEDYEWYKSHKICPLCRIRDASPNRTWCDECAERERVKRLAMSPEAKEASKAKARERSRKIREERKAAGLCTRCGRPLEKYNTRTECDFCKADKRKRDKARHGSNQYAELGVCLWCGAARIPDKKFCRKCYERKAAVGRANILENRKLSPWVLNRPGGKP